MFGGAEIYHSAARDWSDVCDLDLRPVTEDADLAAVLKGLKKRK